MIYAMVKVMQAFYYHK